VRPALARAALVVPQCP
jgi:cytochrome c biogenesis protein ResB